jgi:hypothetical protein
MNANDQRKQEYHMSKKQRQPAGNKSGMAESETINREIDRLMEQLAAKGMCPSPGSALTIAA